MGMIIGALVKVMAATRHSRKMALTSLMIILSREILCALTL